MPYLMKAELLDLHRTSSDSKKYSKNVKIVGCFSCSSIYPSQEIDEYVNLGQTALCPFCSIDAVIPLDDFQPIQYKEVLEELNDYFFRADTEEFSINIQKE